MIARVYHVVKDKYDANSPDHVYIGRRNNRYRLQQSKWANMFCVDEHGRDEAIRLYAIVIQTSLIADPKYWNIEELRDKKLFCWCYPSPCHGDVLLEILGTKIKTN